MQETVSFRYIGTVVNVENLGERIGPEPQVVGQQCPLEVTHTALATGYALAECREGAWRQSVDATADVILPTMPNVRDNTVKQISIMPVSPERNGTR